MFFVVTVQTKIFKVVPVQCDARIIYVPSVEMDFVMDNVTGNDQTFGQTSLAQSTD